MAANDDEKQPSGNTPVDQELVEKYFTKQKTTLIGIDFEYYDEKILEIARKCVPCKGQAETRLRKRSKKVTHGNHAKQTFIHLICFMFEI